MAIAGQRPSCKEIPTAAYRGSGERCCLSGPGQRGCPAWPPPSRVQSGWHGGGPAPQPQFSRQQLPLVFLGEGLGADSPWSVKGRPCLLRRSSCLLPPQKQTQFHEGKWSLYWDSRWTRTAGLLLDGAAGLLCGLPDPGPFTHTQAPILSSPSMGPCVPGQPVPAGAGLSGWGASAARAGPSAQPRPLALGPACLMGGGRDETEGACFALGLGSSMAEGQDQPRQSPPLGCTLAQAAPSRGPPWELGSFPYLEVENCVE